MPEKMPVSFDLNQYGISTESIIRNASPARLYEEAILFDEGAAISDTGAIMLRSGEKTGRSPLDKRVVKLPESEQDVWWGDINIPMELENFETNKERAVDYLNMCDRVYVFDGFAGWDPKYQIKVRIICTRPYHALFMQNQTMWSTMRVDFRPINIQIRSPRRRVWMCVLKKRNL
jgi:phosphoenolpyruvate carboxykinase (ATP)